MTPSLSTGYGSPPLEFLELIIIINLLIIDWELYKVKFRAIPYVYMKILTSVDFFSIFKTSFVKVMTSLVVFDASFGIQQLITFK